MKTPEQSKSHLMDKSMALAVHITNTIKNQNELKKHIIGKQLIRSGTSVGANICEAQNAESRKDFIHKLKIAAKEAHETQYWLQLAKETFPSGEWLAIVEINNEVLNILCKSLITAIRNQNRREE